MTKRNRTTKRKSSRRGQSGPPPHLAASAAVEALRRAALAAGAGKLGKADRELRLAERLSKTALGPLLQKADGDEEGPSGEPFRRELEMRINRYREEERAQLDAMKRADPAAWQAAFDAALEETRQKVVAFWTGDPHLFAEDEPAKNAG